MKESSCSNDFFPGDYANIFGAFGASFHWRTRKSTRTNELR